MNSGDEYHHHNDQNDRLENKIKKKAEIEKKDSSERWKTREMAFLIRYHDDEILLHFMSTVNIKRLMMMMILVMMIIMMMIMVKDVDENVLIMTMRSLMISFYFYHNFHWKKIKFAFISSIDHQLPSRSE